MDTDKKGFQIIYGFSIGDCNDDERDAWLQVKLVFLHEW